MARLSSIVGKLSGIALLAMLGAGTALAQYGYGDPQNGYYQVGQYTAERARNSGYQDGIAEGERDRATGHSFRPTHSDRYEDASDHGNREGLSRGQYKDTYRQAFINGYQRGYGYYGGRSRNHDRDDDDGDGYNRPY